MRKMWLRKQLLAQQKNEYFVLHSTRNRKDIYGIFDSLYKAKLAANEYLAHDQTEISISYELELNQIPTQIKTINIQRDPNYVLEEDDFNIGTSGKKVLLIQEYHPSTNNGEFLGVFSSLESILNLKSKQIGKMPCYKEWELNKVYFQPLDRPSNPMLIIKTSHFQNDSQNDPENDPENDPQNDPENDPQNDLEKKVQSLQLKDSKTLPK